MQPSDNNSTAGIVAGIAAAFAISAWLANFAFLVLLEPTDRGTFGDMFGAVNSIFSGLVLIGVVYGIFLQREEVRLTKFDVEQTKLILSEQQKQLALQNDETKRQMFENTFFRLLTLLGDITSQMDLRAKDGSITKGKDVFPVLLRRLRQASNALNTTQGAHTLEDAYQAFYKESGGEIGHYFRVMFNVVKFVDESTMPNKKFYTNLLRAQLSDVEVAILFHNGLSTFGSEKLKPLIEKYALLKNLRDGDLLSTGYRGMYDPSAYG